MSDHADTIRLLKAAHNLSNEALARRFRLPLAVIAEVLR